MKNNNDIYTNYIVSYIDVLGQKALLENIRDLTETTEGKVLLKTEKGRNKFEEIREKTYGSVLELRQTFENALKIFGDKILSHHELNTLSPEDQHEIKRIAKPMSYHFFSDTITIYAPLQREDELKVRYCIAATFFACMETMLLKFSNGTFFRGGIEVGEGIEFPSGGIYGLALNDAYNLEKETAEYPRVVVGNKLAELIQNKEKKTKYSKFLSRVNTRLYDLCGSLIIKDKDGNFIIDFLGKTFADLCPGYLRERSQRYIGNACKAIGNEYTKALSEGDEKLSHRFELLKDYYFERLGNWGLEYTTIILNK